MRTMLASLFALAALAPLAAAAGSLSPSSARPSAVATPAPVTASPFVSTSPTSAAPVTSLAPTTGAPTNPYAITYSFPVPGDVSGLAINQFGQVVVSGTGANSSLAHKGVLALNPVNGTVLSSSVDAFALSQSLGNGDVARDSNGVIYACSGRVLVKYTTGNLTTSNSTFLIGPSGAGAADFRALIVDALNHIWLADYSGGRVFKVNSTGAVLGTYAGLFLASGIALDASRMNVYVSSERGSSLLCLNNSGFVLGNFSLFSLAPRSLAVDANGAIWATNATSLSGAVGRNIVQIDNTTGSVLSSFPVGLNPTHIFIDPLEFVWVVNFNDSSVSKLSPTGVLIGTYFPLCARPIKATMDSAMANLFVACASYNGSAALARIYLAATHMPTSSPTMPTPPTTQMPSRSPTTLAPTYAPLSPGTVAAAAVVASITIVALVAAISCFCFHECKKRREESKGPTVTYKKGDLVLVECDGVPWSATIQHTANQNKLSVMYHDDKSVEHNVKQRRVLERIKPVDLPDEVYKKGDKVLVEYNGVGYAGLVLAADNKRRLLTIYYADDKSTETGVGTKRVTQRINAVIDHPDAGFQKDERLVVDCDGIPYVCEVVAYNEKNQTLRVFYPDDKTTEDKVAVSRVENRVFTKDMTHETYHVHDTVLVNSHGILRVAFISVVHGHLYSAFHGHKVGITFLDDNSVEDIFTANVRMRLNPAPADHYSMSVAVVGEDEAHHHAYKKDDQIVVEYNSTPYVAVVSSVDSHTGKLTIYYPDDKTSETDVDPARVGHLFQSHDLSHEAFHVEEKVIVECDFIMWSAEITAVHQGHKVSVKYLDDNSTEDDIATSRIKMKL